MTAPKPPAGEVGVERMLQFLHFEGEEERLTEHGKETLEAIRSILTDYARVKEENERILTEIDRLGQSYDAMREAKKQERIRAEKAEAERDESRKAYAELRGTMEAELRDLRAENERLWKSRAKEIVNTAIAARDK